MKIVLSVYVGICFSFLLNFYLGDAGIIQHQKLECHRNLLLNNVSELKQINQKLNHELEVLTTDSEIIQLLSRELGYYENDDNIIMIEGYPEKRNFHEIGKLIINNPEKIKFNIFIKIPIYIIPLLFFIFLNIVWKKKEDGNK
jgi:hypothetical protein